MEYFDDEEFGERAGGIFLRTNLSRKQANEYLSVMTPIVNYLVDEETRKMH